MKPLLSLVRCAWLAVVLVVLGGAHAFAQPEVPTSIAIPFQSSLYVNSGQTLFGGFGASLVDARGLSCGSGVTGAAAASGPIAYCNLLPSKTYTLSVSGGSFASGRVTFSLPTNIPVR